MKKITIITILLFTTVCLYSQAPKLDWVPKVGAKQFPAGKKVFRVNASSDTSTVVTKAIQATIDECAQKGGGIV
ncbi:MAG TPA: glycoside hydrolase family 28 protein, partial [Chitinophagaceae bacterium]|nr:glycoside hydrolase family 28 protein [Chitinophagaceae bacterium]